MSSAATALSPPVKSPRKRGKCQRKETTGPTVSDRILKVVSGSTESGDISLAAVKKALQADGYDVSKKKARVAAIKRLVLNESLVQTKGSGASGSFKPSKKRQTPGKKKKAKRVKKKKASAKLAGREDKKPREKRMTMRKAKRPRAVPVGLLSSRKSKGWATMPTRTRDNK